ncbi:MAG: PAS domain S-box protein, partial [Desulfobacterales bacterium]|nr:PAS domain S-box protein [Desulfobacterales bacterium]
MPHLIRNKGLPFLLFFLISYFPPVFCRAETSDAPPQGGEFFSALPGVWILTAAILLAVVAISIIANIFQYLQKKRLEDEIVRYRKIARDAVEQQKAIKDIFDHLNDHVFFHDMEGNLYEVSASVQRDADYTESELKQMNIKDLVPEQFKSQVDEYLERIRRNGSDRGYLRVVNKAGEEMLMEYNNTLIYDQNGSVVGVRGISRNITEQYRARKASEKSEKKYRTILETIEDGYYEVDLRGTYKFLNNSALRILGYRWEELAGKSYKSLIAEDDVGQVFETFNYVYRTGRPVKAFHWRSVCKDGSICHLETSVSLLFDDQGKAAGFQGIIRDISDRIKAQNKQKELEAQLQQAQKMESIGTLAGGIAHDFNNILFPMIGYTELAMQDLPEESTAYQNLKKVMKSAERAKALVQQILNFSRQSSNESAEPVYIQPVLKETVKLLKNTVPSFIDIQANIDENTGKVFINLAQMHQVIMNLCTNAYQAMENLEAGRMCVDLKQMEITEETSPDHYHLTPGSYACITVSDTGSGIPPEIREKIFEPYFTTKPQEKGTGLGLSVSYGIIKNAGGIITVESTSG